MNGSTRPSRVRSCMSHSESSTGADPLWLDDLVCRPNLDIAVVADEERQRRVPLEPSDGGSRLRGLRVRRLCDRAAAWRPARVELIAALLSQLVPMGALTATLLAEPYSYPVLLLCVLLAIDALATPVASLASRDCSAALFFSASPGAFSSSSCPFAFLMARAARPQQTRTRVRRGAAPRDHSRGRARPAPQPTTRRQRPSRSTSQHRSTRSVTRSASIVGLVRDEPFRPRGRFRLDHLPVGRDTTRAARARR